MDVSFSYFIAQVFYNQILALTVLLTLGVIFVNGETDALNASPTCVTIALGGADGVNMNEWVKVLYGLVLSLGLGFAAGWGVCKIVTLLFANTDRRKSNTFFRWAQIAGAAGMSFMHGAQDGQKFIGVLFLGVAFCNGQSSVENMIIPVWLKLLCSVVMGVGTSVGGEKIIKSGGMDMVKLEKYQGFSADLSSSLCLLLATLTGIPVSTTHVKTTAIMGVGAVKRISAINFGVVKDMLLTWIFTFPPGFHHARQDHGHHGRGCGEAHLRHQLRRGQGHAPNLDLHLPGLRPHQFLHGQALPAVHLVRIPSLPLKPS